MKATRNRRASLTVWNTAITIIFLVAAMLVGPKDLSAQRPLSTNAAEPGIISEQADFTGSWFRDAGRGQKRLQNYGFDETIACQELKDALGAPLKRCNLPFSKLKEHLNARAFAWLKFADERLSSKWYCAPPTVPVLLASGTWTFTQVSGSEWEIDHLSPFVGVVRRKIWMDGRTHPGPGHLYYEGHTIGWFEQGDLVLETTNFTFDPTGLEDYSLLPSSFRKKVTERYKKVSADKLMVTVTYEDPLFLKKPFTWTFELVKTSRPEAAASVCDPDYAALELETTIPNRYEDK
jgi:hypothetical protein